MKVPRYRYPAQLGPEPGPLLAEIATAVLEGGHRPEDGVIRFEQAFARYLGVPHARGVDCGTDALVIALWAVGVGPGDEVITQANTFHATVAAIRLAGASPTLVDADDRTFLMDTSQLPAAIGCRTRAIVPVHLYGKPTPMTPILDLAHRHGLTVVEDAAQAHGARVEGRAVGTFGEAGCFSFHPSKNLAAVGNGGAVVTASDAVAERVSRLRDLGQSRQNDHVAVGLHSKLDAIQSLILAWKLPMLDRGNELRRQAARRYRERLADLPVELQGEEPGEAHAWHLFQVRTPRRDALLSRLQEAGIDAVVRYPVPIHLQPAFAAQGWRPGQFPVAERLARELLCLPMRPDLTEDEIDYVSDVVHRFFRDSAVAA